MIEERKWTNICLSSKKFMNSHIYLTVCFGIKLLFTMAIWCFWVPKDVVFDTHC